MRLLNCHIYNFGKYHNYKVDFSSDLHEIYLQNGEGKTTLVSFIVATFFGGEVENIQNLLTKYQSLDHPNDRYGGSINFIYDGDEYELIHTFNTKQNKNKFKSEILKLTKKGSKNGIDRFDDDSPITYLFKDIEKPTSAILNTVILSHETFTKNNDQSLDDLFSSQLGELYDIKEFDDVIKALDDKIKEYGGNPRATKTLYKKVTNEEKSVYDQMKAKEKEIKVKKDELIDLYGVDGLRKGGGYISSLDKDIENIEKEIETLKLDSSKIDQYTEYSQIEKSLTEKEKEIEKLNEEINNQNISNEVLTNFENLNIEIKNEKEKVDDLLSEQKSIIVDENYLSISSKEVENIKKTYNEYKSYEHKVDGSINKSHTTNKKSLTNVFALLTCVFLIILIVGLILMSSLEGNSMFSYGLIGVGALGSIGSLIGLFVYNNKKNKSNEIDVSNVIENVENKEILEKKSLLEGFFKKLKLSTTDLRYSYETFLSNYDHNTSLHKKSEEIQNQLNALNDSLKKKETDLLDELYKYGYDSKESVDAFLYHLRNTHKVINEKKNEIESIKNKLKDSKFKGFDMLDKAKLNYQSNLNLINEFEIKKTDLLNKRNEFLDKLNEYNKDMEEHRILKDRSYELSARIREYKELASRYIKGKDLLIEAKESIYASTYDPFIKELDKILDLEKNNEQFFKSYEIKTDDKSSQIVFKNKGVEKTATSLSQGYQDYLKLAVRFSFLNMIYKKEKPFIILDDPLVNMDKDRLNNIKQIIKTLSKDYQIIYFYCHDSRKIK